MTQENEPLKMAGVIQIDEKPMQEHLGERVRATVEGALNAITDPVYVSPMYSASYNIFGKPTTVALGWNANGSLGSQTVTDTLPGANDNQVCSYAEDGLGRLASANCVNGSTGVWSQTFSPDAFGNVSKTNTTGIPGDAFAVGFTNANQIAPSSGFPAYDANGNLLDDPVTGQSGAYAWDAEGRPLWNVNSWPITDALGRVVEIDYASDAIEGIFFGPDGSKMGYMDGNGAMTSLDLALPGGVRAVYEFWSANPVAYEHPDWLGSMRVFSDWSRSLEAEGDYAPYGESYAAASGSCCPMTFFTGEGHYINSTYVYDPNEHLFRQYSPEQGRWLSPDPLGLGAVDPTDPQTWNRYAYVRGNPLELTDPTGLIIPAPPPSCTSKYSWLNPLCYFAPPNPTQPKHNDPPGIGRGGGGTTGPGPVTQPPTPTSTQCPQGQSLQPATPAQTQSTNVAADPNFQAVNTLAAGYASVTRLLKVAAAVGGMAVSAGGLAVAGAGAASGGCAEPTPAEPLTCGAGIFAAAHAFAGAGIQVGAAIYITKTALIPSTREVFTHSQGGALVCRE